jgi:hypothetical protein
MPASQERREDLAYDWLLADDDAPQLALEAAGQVRRLGKAQRFEPAARRRVHGIVHRIVVILAAGLADRLIPKPA